MKQPISKEAYTKLLQHINDCDNHISKVLKKYKRILVEAKRNNDIESAYLAYELMSMILGGTSTKYFSAVNNKLKRSLKRASTADYTLEEYTGSKFQLQKDEEYWVLTNLYTGEKFYSRFYEEEM